MFGKKSQAENQVLKDRISKLEHEIKILRYYALRAYTEAFKEKGEDWMRDDFLKYLKKMGIDEQWK